jgi:hypothetical protein
MAEGRKRVVAVGRVVKGKVIYTTPVVPKPTTPEEGNK